MTVDSNLLRYKIKCANLTMVDLSAKLNLFQTQLQDRIAGRTAFKDYEVNQLKNILRLSSNEVMDIFYQGIILTNEGIQEVDALHELNLYIKLRFKGEITVKADFEKMKLTNTLKNFLSEWIRNPNQNLYTYPLSDLDLKFYYKFFALHDILIKKIDGNAIETHARLFEKVRIKLKERKLELTINNKQLREI